MTKWEPRCIKCGCWRVIGKGYCIHRCKQCKDKNTDQYAIDKVDVKLDKPKAN